MPGGSRKAAAEQSLTAEAAAVLKESQTLARRRNHPQITPLHVAATLVSLKNTPLPSSTRALQLCLNVALDRLPTTAGHGGSPLSHALSAALKRAHAHQRRLSSPSSPPLLPLQIDLHHLSFSILHDPSVSRVFHAASLSPPSSAHARPIGPSHALSSAHGGATIASHGGGNGVLNGLSFPSSAHGGATGVLNALSPPSSSAHGGATGASHGGGNGVLKGGWAERVVEGVVVGGKSVVVVGERGERVVEEVVRRMEEGGGVRVIRVVGLRGMVVEEVRRKVVEEEEEVGGLRVVIYFGDLKCVVEDATCGIRGGPHTPPVAFVLEALAGVAARSDRISLLATATYSTYVACRIVCPSLLFRCSLHAFAINPSFRSLLNSKKVRGADNGIQFSHATSRNRTPQTVCSESWMFSLPTEKFNPNGGGGLREENVTLTLGTHPPSPSVTPADWVARLVGENLPWQAAAIPSIIEALAGSEYREETWVLIRGDDRIGKRRLALVIAEAFFGSLTSLLHIDLADHRRHHQTPMENSTGVVMLENVDSVEPESAVVLMAEIRESIDRGGGGGRIFLATEGGGDSNGRELDFVIRMRMQEKGARGKRRRRQSKIDLNREANLESEEEEEGASPGSSELTTEQGDDEGRGLAERMEGWVLLERKDGEEEWVREEIEDKVVKGVRGVEIEGLLLEEMVSRGGSFVGGLLDRWVKHVVHKSLDETGTFETAVRLCFDGRDFDPSHGFMGSCLPTQIHTSFD